MKSRAAPVEHTAAFLRRRFLNWFPIYAKEVWVLPGDHWLRYGSWGDARIVAGIFAIAAISFWLGARAKGPRKGWLFVAGALLFLIPFLRGGWGGILFVAGVIGANVAGWVSDLFFGSRRAPVAGEAVRKWTKMDAADPAAPPVITTIEKGDRILGLAGTAEGLRERLARGPFTTWEDVSSAVAAVPAVGIGGAGRSKRSCAIPRPPCGLARSASSPTDRSSASIRSGWG